MYVYLYDNFLRQNRYESALKSIETKLTDYGIAGKIIRLQNFTNAEWVIEDEIRKGAKTVIIMGNDSTFGHVLSRGASCDVLFGFIPIGPENSIAEVLGIPSGVEAADVLAKRRVVKLDVGWFNNRYFVSKLYIPPSFISVEYDERFKVESSTKKMELVVCNLQPFHWKKSVGMEQKEYIVHPQDGKLEAFLRPVLKKTLFRAERLEDPSIFPFEEMVVQGATPFEVQADGKISKETKITIKLAKKRIQMIVGRSRRF